MTEEQLAIENRREITALLVTAEKRKWFGCIKINIKAGKIHLIRCEQTMKPISQNNSKKGLTLDSL